MNLSNLCKSTTLLTLLILLWTSSQSQISPSPHCDTQCNFSQIVADNDVRTLEIVGETAWLGTTGGLIKYDLSNDTYTKYTTNDGLRNNGITKLAPSNDESVWISTDNGLCKFQDDCFYFDDRPNLENDNIYRQCINDMFVDDQNRLWSICSVWSDYQLSVYDDSDQSTQYFSKFNPDSTYYNPAAFAKGNNNDIWLLFQPNHDTDDLELVWFDMATGNFEVKKTLNGILFSPQIQVLENGELWFDTYNTIHHYIPDADELIEKSVNGPIKSFVIDPQTTGNPDIWYIEYFNPYLNKNNNDNPISILEADFFAYELKIVDDKMWIATSNGFFEFDKESEFIPKNLNNKFRTNWLRTLASDNDNNIWLGYRDSYYPIAKYNTATSEIQYFENINSNSIESIFIDGNTA